ncbi:hypothetical protein OG204_00495 [Streptomyces sp. NBC_01387]|uniref:hypothetical protein n=1 Tax=Streptomyces sp. NBC_01387 TaxID=2903849 RepID=UPI003250AE39
MDNRIDVQVDDLVFPREEFAEKEAGEVHAVVNVGMVRRVVAYHPHIRYEKTFVESAECHEFTGEIDLFFQQMGKPSLQAVSRFGDISEPLPSWRP